MPSELIRLKLNGEAVEVAPGTTVAAALMNHGLRGFRQSVTGQARGPVCGMGVCHECRVTIDGRPHQKSCQVLCREGIEVTTDA